MNPDIEEVKKIILEANDYKPTELDDWYEYPDGYTRKGLPLKLVEGISQICQLLEKDDLLAKHIRKKGGFNPRLCGVCKELSKEVTNEPRD